MLSVFRLFLGVCLIPVVSLLNEQPVEKEFVEERQEMVRRQLIPRDITDSRVLEAMMEVPRHRFVPEALWSYAYADSPLPIGLDQTISQPYIVALMTQLGDTKPVSRALEIGTGSGYQAAVLSRLVKEVYSIEIIPELAARSRTTLKRLGYENVTVRLGDGYAGWPEQAPFDLILITAAAPRIPEPLIEQLAEGGRLIVPVGAPGGYQELLVVRKKGDEINRKTVIPVRFVPMTGEVQKPK